MGKKRYWGLNISISFLKEDIVTTSNETKSDVCSPDLNWETFTTG